MRNLRLSVAFAATLVFGHFFEPSVAAAAEYALAANQDVIGEIRYVTAREEDTFVSIARLHGVGFEELRQANPGVDPWLPGEGTRITVPMQHVLPNAPRRGIVVNVADLRLYYYPSDEPGKVYTYPISIGRLDWVTPIGTTTVTAKHLNPSWYPPQSIRDEHAARGDILPAVVPPGPDNPLGDHSLRLGLPGYLIHGTNRPAGVGMRVTHGCVRMFPEDIEALFQSVPVGTPVRIVNQPFKLGFMADGSMMLEVHPPLAEEVEAGKWTLTDLTRAYVAVTETRYAEVDWDTAEAIMHEAAGVPGPIAYGVPIGGDETLEAAAETSDTDEIVEAASAERGASSI